MLPAHPHHTTPGWQQQPSLLVPYGPPLQALAPANTQHEPTVSPEDADTIRRLAAYHNVNPLELLKAYKMNSNFLREAAAKHNQR